MSEIERFEPFAFNDRPVRTLLLDGEPAFVHADVCAILEIGNPSDALRRLDQDEHTLVSIDGPNGRRDLNVVTESGLYALILGSRKPQARPFKRWVTHEVLPQIRRTGSYSATAAPAIPDMSTVEGQLAVLDMVRAQVEARKVAEQRVAELEPAAESWQVLADAEGDYSLRDAAQILSREPRIEIGQNRLAKLLRRLGWVDGKTKRPYQAQIDNGRLAAIVDRWTDDDGVTHVKYTARVTPKGLHALREHLAGVKALPVRFPADDVWSDAS